MHIILIGGAQRSGTTLLQTLLASTLPNAPVIPECHILFDLLYAYQRAASSEWPKTSWFYDTRDDLATFFRGTVERHLADIGARYESAEYMVLKNPNLARVLRVFSRKRTSCFLMRNA